MKPSVQAGEKIVKYSFRDKRLLEEALTHSSYTVSASYERLEFIGDAALGLAFSKYIFMAYPDLDPGQLTLMRAANVSNEKLARVAIRLGLYGKVRRSNTDVLDEKVREFAKAVKEEEEDDVMYGGSVKAPKILADIVESVAAAIYVDIDFNLQRLWEILKGLLEPIVTLEDLQQHPVSMLFALCQKQGKQVDIEYCMEGTNNIARVYVNGGFVASGSSKQTKKNAKLNAAKEAVPKLLPNAPLNVGVRGICGVLDLDGAFEIEGAKQKLQELCVKKKWPKPGYSVEKDAGPSHDKKFICSVRIGVHYMKGEEKSRVKEAENSAASLMIRSLHDSNYQIPNSGGQENLNVDNADLGRTRLGSVEREAEAIVRAGGIQVLEKLNSARKNFPMKIFLLLLGFCAASELASNKGDWDDLVAGIVVVLVAGIVVLLVAGIVCIVVLIVGIVDAAIVGIGMLVYKTLLCLLEGCHHLWPR